MRLVATAAAAALIAGQAAAQAPAAGPIETASGATVYPAAFFASARPTNALDMIQRLPGFSFSAGAADVRGFAGSGGNVLIDGERPAAKAVPLDVLLRRIPAESVERIELVRGGAPGIDMQGQAIVANVVRSGRAATTWAATGGARLYPDRPALPEAEFEWSRRSPGLSLEGSLFVMQDLGPPTGRGRDTARTAAGVASHPYFAHSRDTEARLTAAAEMQGEVDAFRANLSLEQARERTVERLSLPARAEDRTLERETERQGELGLDWERQVNGWIVARLIGLQTLGRTVTREDAVDPRGSEASHEDERASESIVRAALSFRRWTALSVEAGAEAALNRLDARTALTEDGVPLVVPNANVVVTERRGEAFAQAFWTPRRGLAVEATARIETSRIEQEGDTDRAERFVFLKPRLTVAWDAAPDVQLRARLEREVGQLDFGDFTAGAELATGTVSAGGAELKPEHAWVVEAAVERRFWGRGAVVLTVSHARVKDVIDLAPLPGGFDGPANIGEGRREEASLALTAPLDRLGVSGGLLTGKATWRRSSVRDPVTGADRRISEQRPLEGDIRFSQDLVGLRSTWGVDLNLGYEQTVHRINEVRTDVQEPTWNLYWDWKPAADLSLRVQVENLTSRERRIERDRYAGPRSVAAIRSVERRASEFDPFLLLRLRKAL